MLVRINILRSVRQVMSAEEVNITPPLKTTPHALETTACPDTGKLGLVFFFQFRIIAEPIPENPYMLISYTF